MEDYIYSEQQYLSKEEFNICNNILIKHEFAPEEIQDDDEFQRVFEYFVGLTERFPFHIQTYEYLLRMIGVLEMDEDLQIFQKVIENAWFEASMGVAKKDKIFDKKVEWGWMENRPLIRGLYNGANMLWQEGKTKKAHELFSKILKTNENDNIGARYTVKATGEGMSFEEFEKRFVTEDEYGSSYRTPELWEWFGEEN